MLKCNKNKKKDKDRTAGHLKAKGGNVMNETVQNNSEENKYKIYFNAREWSLCSDASSSKCERTFVTDFENGLSEAYCIGDKSQYVTEIGTKQLILEKNTGYTFYFWVKIDRNLKNEAVCQLQIVYNGDFENKRVYVLSNGNIKPAKTVDGWQLFQIPFVTEDNEYTQLRFSAKSSVCSIIPGKEVKYYYSLSDDIPEDEYTDDTDNTEDTDSEQNPFKNISDSFRDFFGQFDTQKKTETKQENSGNDPFAAFNDFAQQIRREVRREVNKNIRNDVYSDIRAMKDEIVNELKNTFGNNNNNDK